MSDTRARSLWAQGLDRLLSLASNWISLFGLLLMSMALVMLIAFAVLALRQGTGNPYLNVIGYLVVPGVFLAAAVCMTGMSIYSDPQHTLPWIGVLLAGIPVYYIWNRYYRVPDASLMEQSER